MTEREVYDRIQQDLQLIAQHRQMYLLREVEGPKVNDDSYTQLARQFKYTCLIVSKYCPKDCMTGPYIHPLRLLTGSGNVKSRLYLDREWIWSDAQINKKEGSRGQPKVMKGRGRPKKTVPTVQDNEPEVKRGRGRPKWTPGIKEEPKMIKTKKAPSKSKTPKKGKC